jgi:ATP-dependent DNA ligase
MDLPVMPPVAPMLAKPVAQLPDGPYSFEPKWDGFRTIVFRDGQEVELGSRKERPLTRYFPELVAAVKTHLPDRCVIDAEVVVPDPAGLRLDWDALLLRIHPAASQVALLASQTPARLVAFDLLALGDEDWTGQPFARRRAALEDALARAGPPVHLTRAATNRRLAAEWLARFEGAGLDGVVAKRLDGVYEPDRRAWFKVKHARTADCVVGGYRLHKRGADLIGSLLLGLYTDAGELASVGVVGAFPLERRRELFAELQPLVTGFEGHPWDWAPGSGRPRPPGAPGAAPTPAAGTRARSCRLSRCGPSGWWRSATTTWRGAGSATPPSSSAGGRTATPAPAPTSSWRRSSPTTWPISWHGRRPGRAELSGAEEGGCATRSSRRPTGTWRGPAPGWS